VKGERLCDQPPEHSQALYAEMPSDAKAKIVDPLRASNQAQEVAQLAKRYQCLKSF
jgi:hypothetical protein